MSKYFLLIPFMSLVFAGCGGSKPTAEIPSSQSEQQESAKEVQTHCPYDKDICDYIAAQTDLYTKPFIMSTVSNAAPDSTTVTTMDGKGNMHAITTTKGNVDAEIVQFNNVTYTKDNSDGKWFKMPTDDQSAFNLKGQVEQLKETLQDKENTLTFTKVGEELCGTLTCLIYEMVDTENAALGKTKIWIDTKEHAARKMMVGEGTYSTTIVYTYEPVSITEPTPVKELTMPNIPGLHNNQLPPSDDAGE